MDLPLESVSHNWLYLVAAASEARTGQRTSQGKTLVFVLTTSGVAASGLRVNAKGIGAISPGKVRRRFEDERGTLHFFTILED
jgi:hypothetical protein